MDEQLKYYKDESFKLLAIRPMSQKHCGVLKVKELYQFYSDYHFVFDKNNHEVLNIIHEPSLANSLYDITRPDGSRLKVNISAIVGMNGSGKSTLIELLFAFCYVLASNKNIISKDLKRVGNTQVDTLKNFKIEIYYQNEKGIFKLIYDSNKIYNRILTNGKWAVERFEFRDFFYSIAINYSIYGLNTKNTGWLYSLFHKNDAYQTPVVINPYRSDGIINVNQEYHLAQSRLLSNISSFFNQSPEIVKGKKIIGIDFVVDPINLDFLDFKGHKKPLKEILDFIQKDQNVRPFDILSKALFRFTEFEFKEAEAEMLENELDHDLAADLKKKYSFREKYDHNHIKVYFIKYILRKIFKICLTYPEYGTEFIRNYDEIMESPRTTFPEFRSISFLLSKLKHDRSHITLKLRQALFLLKSDFFSNDNIKAVRNDKLPNKVQLVISQSFSDYKNKVDISYKENLSRIREKIDVVPGAFARPLLRIEGNTKFTQLSSGELQFLHTFHTIIYHLFNINSVANNSGNSSKHTYRNINIILDEIELYFHPEYQRSFVSEMLAGIAMVSLENIASINIVFSTHSPFILSDIPGSNVLELKDGKPFHSKEIEQTFAANIIDILSSKFFMEESMGKFASNKIESLIDQIKASRANEEELQLVELIGDPYLKSSLNQFISQKND